MRIRSLLQNLAVPRGRWMQLLGCAVLAFSWLRMEEEVKPPETAPSEDSVARTHGIEPSTSLHAGFGLATMDVIVGQNDTLERIFRRLELSLSDLAALRSIPELRRQLDRLYPGELLKFSYRGEQFVGIERRLNESETLKVLRDTDGFVTETLSNPLESEIRTARGVIRNSLFRAAEAAGLADVTALAIAEIFAWDIDFVLEVQPGDAFTVTYEQLYQDGEYVRDGRILAVEFVNGGRSFRAVRYVGEDGTAGYYTPDGRSLRKAFLRAPLEFSRVSSRFNMFRRHPVLNRIRAHKGVDYAAPIGTPVRAAGEGRVAFVGVQNSYGKVVQIQHPHGVETVYGHLSRFASGLSRGARVEQGKVIGYVGMTGLATGPHLHYEYRVNGVYKDPQTVPLPKAAPVPAAEMATFLAQTAPWVQQLEAAIATDEAEARVAQQQPGGARSAASVQLLRY